MALAGSVFLIMFRWPRQVATAKSALAVEGGKYLAVGVLAFVVDVFVFNLLAHGPGGGPLHDSPITAKIISTLISGVVSFAGNRWWTFNHGRHARPLRQTVLFVLVNAAAWGIMLTPLAISRYVLNLDSAAADNISANVVGLGLALVFRFWAYRRWVFYERPHAPQDLRTSESSCTDVPSG